MRWSGRSREALFYALRLAISAGLLAFIVTRIDWPLLSAAAAHLRWSDAALALVTVWIAVWFRALSFSLVVNRSGRLISLSAAMGLTLAGSAAALVLPGVAGELMKAGIGSRVHGSPERIVAGTVIDKLTSLVAVGAIAAVAASTAGYWALASIGAVIGAVAAVPLAAPRVVPWRWILRLTAPRSAVSADILATSITPDPKRYALVTAVSLAGWMLSFGSIALLCRAFGLAVPFRDVVIAGCSMTIASLVPLSLAGLGIAQVSLVGALAALGVRTDAAAQVALAQLAIVLTPAVSGAVLLAVGLRRRVRPRGSALNVHMLTTVYPRSDDDFTGHFVAGLARSLADLGTEVTVNAPHAPGLAVAEESFGVRVARFRYLPERFERLGYTAIGIPAELRRRRSALLELGPMVLGLWAAARRAARHADVVHAHWAPTGFIAALAAGGTPLVVTIHGTDVALAERSRLWRSVALAALRRARAAICVSTALAARTRALPGFPGTPLVVIGNGVPESLFEFDRNHQRGAAPRIIFAGRLTEAKGVPGLLEAFARMPGAAVLEIVGEGPLGDSLRVRAQELGVTSRVAFAGAIDHSQALERMASADLVVVPSDQEGFSLVALEAAALGVPCIGSRVGALPDLLADEALFEPGDVEGLSSLMQRVVTDPDLADALASQARTRARDFTWTQIAARTLEVYRRVSEGSV